MADTSSSLFGRSIDFDKFVPQAGIFLLYVLTLFTGVAIASGFDAAGLSHMDGGSAGHLGFIFLEILAVTVVFLAVGRFGYGELLVKLGQYAVLAYVLGHFVGAFTGGLGVVEGAVGIGVSAVLWVHYEWYVLDAVAVALCATIITALGLGFVPHLVVAFLVVMAAYDAFAVYESEHMQSLVGVGTDLDIPMMFVVPRDPTFRLSEADSLSDSDANVSALGLGDALFPGMLVVSAASYLDAAAVVTVAGFPLGAPAVGAFVGAVLGMVVVTVVIHLWERTHPALPYINSVTITGYAVGALAAGVPLATAFGL